MFEQVSPLFRGRRLAIEIGSGAGDRIFEHAASFDRVRGVDASPDMVARLTRRAEELGIGNAAGFLVDQPWDEPTGSADYVYSSILPSIEDWVELANYLQRTSMVLGRGGIAQFRFDTRPTDLRYRLRKRLSGKGPDDGSGPSFRRTEGWVRDRMRGADLEIIGERGQGTADHWVVARRR